MCLKFHDQDEDAIQVLDDLGNLESPRGMGTPRQTQEMQNISKTSQLHREFETARETNILMVQWKEMKTREIRIDSEKSKYMKRNKATDISAKTCIDFFFNLLYIMIYQQVTELH